RQADFTLVDAVETLERTRQVLAQSEVDILLLDFDFGRERATRFIDDLNGFKGGFTGKILIVTAGVSDIEAMQLIRAGVAGIFHKHNGSEALCQAIRQVAAGQPYLEAAYLPSVFK